MIEFMLTFIFWGSLIACSPALVRAFYVLLTYKWGDK